jgi:beta-galactosidase
MEVWRVSNHRTVSLRNRWRFLLGDAPGAEAVAFEDADWRRLDVPHDWSIAGPRTREASTGTQGGFVPSGIGWYRQTISVPDSWIGQSVWIVFEGVYMNAQVWLNGHLLGVQHYGYSTFAFDLTPHLRPGDDNLLAVRVDNSAQPNSRWYSGSGIYRSVRLEVADPVRFEPFGVSVSTIRADAEMGVIRVRMRVTNETGRQRELTLDNRVLAQPGDGTVLALHSSTISLGAHESTIVSHELSVAKPALWSPEAPALYRLVSRAASGHDLADVVERPFGLCSVRVSAERGFELNGRTVRLNGANVHHDHGPLGAASYPSLERRRVRLLKAAGFNAVRAAHNPPAPAFLDACDELGLLVIDEAFDCWERGKNPADYSAHFRECWQRDLDAMIARDQHHPSVVMWSIGNEVKEIGLPEGVPWAKALAARVRELDPTRPVTCGWNFPWNQAEWVDVDPMFATLDVAGYNYEHKRAAEDHARVPERVMLATESFPADTYACWALAQDAPYFIGDFVWTGIDYLGESGIGRVYAPGEVVRQHWEGEHWPWYGACCGDLDITGARKPISHYRKIVWECGETLYLAVQKPAPGEGAWQPTLWGLRPTLDSWTWPGREGKPLTVEVYSRHERVRLFLNDRLIGEKPTTRAEEFKAVFELVYEPGTLRAVGISGGKELESCALETAGPAAGVRLSAEPEAREREPWEPALLIAEIIDAAGRRVPTSNSLIEFSAAAGAKVVAVATGDLTSPEAYVATSRHAWHGRVLVAIQADSGSSAPSALTITATVPELNHAAHTVSV